MLLPSQRIVAFLRALVAPGPVRAPDGPSSALERLVGAIGAAICLVFAVTLTDVPLRDHRAAPTTPLAPSAPAGDRSCSVRVLDEEGRAATGAVVRAFVVDAEGRVFLGGEQRTTSEGTTEFLGLPRGEAWFLAYGEGRGRASTRTILGERKCDVALALRPGQALALRIVDEAGQPVPGADVSVRGVDPLPHVARGGLDGAAVLDRLGPGPWELHVTAPGYEPVRRANVQPSADPIEVRLVRLGGFEIRVVDADGEPVAFAEVLLSGPGIWPARSTLADADGVALITALPGGVYDLKARLDDRVSATDASVPLARGAMVERTLVLTDGAYVTVRVSDGPEKDGVPGRGLAGARVVLVEDGISAFPLEYATNDQGEVVVGPIGDSPFSTITAEADGFVPRTLSTLDAVDDRLEIPLSRGGVVIGRVLDDRGFPVDGATIEILGTDPDGMPISETAARSGLGDLGELGLGAPLPLIPRGELGVMPGPIPDIPRAGAAIRAPTRAGGDPWVTGLDGTFRASPVTPGKLQVLVRHPEFVEGLSELFTLTPGGEVEVEIVLRRGGRLEGRVLEEDRLPVAGARIELASVVGTFTHVTYAADDGTFTVAGVPEDVVLWIERPDAPGDPAAQLALEIPPGGEREIEVILPRAREKTVLRVVDDRGYPVERVEVRVASLDPTIGLRRTLFTDESGDVTVGGALGLPLRVVAVRPGMAPLVEEIPEALAEHRLVMQRALTARGTVTAREGRDRVAGADVTLYTPAGAEHATTDDEGAFEIPDLAAGRLRVVARHPEHARAEVVLWLEGDPIRPVDLPPIDLSPAGEVEGVVVDDFDQPIAGARVGWDAVPTFLPVGRLPPGLTRTDSEGRFVLGGLPEGSVDLEAYSAELGRGRAEGVEIRAGRTTDRVRIVIPEQGYDPRKLRAAGSVAMTLAERDGEVIVLDVPEGGEAEVAGVEPEDRLLAVGARRVRTLEGARDLLGGPLGEDVVLELGRESKKGSRAPLRLRVRREPVQR